MLAACLLLAAALPLGHALLFPPLHSYVTVEEAAGQEQDASTQEAAPCPGLIISESGLGPDTLPTEEGEQYDLSRLPASAQDGGYPAQQLPSAEGETSSDADTGEGALLLERLTREIQREYGNGTYPDWYGGGYLDSAGDVVVLLVQGCDTQALRSQVRDWAGGGVSFARARYSLASLTKLQEQICAQPSVKAVLSSWAPWTRRTTVWSCPSPGPTMRPCLHWPCWTPGTTPSMSRRPLQPLRSQAPAPPAPGPPANCALDRPLSHIVRAPRHCRGAPLLCRYRPPGPAGSAEEFLQLASVDGHDNAGGKSDGDGGT